MNRSLMTLAGLYGAGAHLRQRAFESGWLTVHQLSRPVISVGNLTVGGSGKTPLVRKITEILLQRGYKPAILTRGYRRDRGDDLIALQPQINRAPNNRTAGDEPAMLARALPQVPIIICANRYRAGQLAEKKFGADVHILDDGFQHFALKRDVDLVAVDVTQRLSNDALLPLGRLREPASALKRADMIVLTRTEIQDPDSTEKQVSQINPIAPVFHCATRLLHLTELGSQETIDPLNFHGKPVCAFCGIGNPSAFFSDLSKWGFNSISETIFRDHHLYNSEDIKRLNDAACGSGAVAFITTEKDAMNLQAPSGFIAPVLACATQTEISDAQKFEQVLLAGLASGQARSKAEFAGCAF